MRPQEVYSETSVDTVVINAYGIGAVTYFMMMTDSPQPLPPRLRAQQAHWRRRQIA